MKVLLRGFLFSLLALCMTIAAPLARAQSLPDGPVTIVVPFPPGGVTDLVARVVATRLGELWKQPVVINNKPGAGGDIGAAGVKPVPNNALDIPLADMNGDGIQDIVRVRRGDLRYGPGRGNGFWGTGNLDDCPAGRARPAPARGGCGAAR